MYYRNNKKNYESTPPKCKHYKLKYLKFGNKKLNVRHMILPSDKHVLSSTLNSMGYTDVSDEYKKLMGINKTEKEVLPAFYFTMVSLDNPFSKLLTDCTIHYAYNKEKKTQLNKQEILSIEDAKTLEEIYENIPMEKINFLNKENISMYFLTKDGTVDVPKIIEFLRNYANIQNSFSTMHLIDPDIVEQISEEDFSSFISIMIKEIPDLEKVESIQTYYVTYVTSLFLFYFGNKATNQMNIYDVFCSQLYSQFINMQYNKTNNPVSLQSALAVYNSFIEQDKDNKGALSRSDIKYTCGYQLSDAFVDRLFDVFQTDKDRFDFVLYLSIVIPLKYMETTQAAQFFFHMIDIDEDGYLSRDDIMYFYKAIVKEMEIVEYNEGDFFTEMLDTAQATSNNITLEAILNSRAHPTFFKRLIDLNMFQAWS